MTDYGQESLWRDTATADAERARDLASRLEHRARAEDEVAARDIYLGLLDIAPGERVLDVGCGSGAVTRELARRVGSGGLAIGVDPSPALLAVARELAREAGVGDRVQFREGSALRLPFPDRSFDAVVCVTVLSHVPNAEAAIPELVRVLRSGGRLGVFDFDTDMTAFTHPDRALTRRIVAAASDATAVNGWLVRQLPCSSSAPASWTSACAASFLSRLICRVSTPNWLSAVSRWPSRRARLPNSRAAPGWEGFQEQGAHGPIVAGRLHIFVWGRTPT